MQELADKLVKMPINRARGHTRRLDPDSELLMLRVGVGHEILTRYRLPNLGVTVTLVEEVSEAPKRQDSDKLRVTYRFVEARVEAIV